MLDRNCLPSIVCVLLKRDSFVQGVIPHGLGVALAGRPKVERNPLALTTRSGCLRFDAISMWSTGLRAFWPEPRVGMTAVGPEYRTMNAFRFKSYLEYPSFWMASNVKYYYVR